MLGSAAAILLDLGSNPPEVLNVSLIEFCVLLSRVSCNGLIPRPEQSYRMCIMGVSLRVIKLNNSPLHLQ